MYGKKCQAEDITERLISYTSLQKLLMKSQGCRCIKCVGLKCGHALCGVCVGRFSKIHLSRLIPIEAMRHCGKVALALHERAT